MKSLLISLLHPIPENTGGKMRTMNFARTLKRHGDVDLVYLKEEPNGPKGPGIFRKEYFLEIVEGNTERHGSGLFGKIEETGRRIARFAGKRPYIISEWPDDSVDRFHDILSKEKYDLIICRYLSNGYPLFKLSGEEGMRVIMDLDDYHSDTCPSSHAGNTGNMLGRYKKLMQDRFLAVYQRKCLGFGAVLVCSNEDRRHLAKQGPGNIHVIPNIYPGHMTSISDRNTGYENLDVFLFVGTLNYGPNVVGLKWFLESVFPKVRREIPDVKLLVVGRRPTKEIRRLCGGIPGIELHADAEDILQYYRKCGVVIVPLLTGGGTRIKILEAGMASRPVLSTPFGAYGLDVEDGTDIMLFSTGEEFLDKYRKLRNVDTYDSITERMKINVEDNHSRESFDKAMDLVVGTVRERAMREAGL